MPIILVTCLVTAPVALALALLGLLRRVRTEDDDVLGHCLAAIT